MRAHLVAALFPAFADVDCRRCCGRHRRPSFPASPRLAAPCPTPPFFLVPTGRHSLIRVGDTLVSSTDPLSPSACTVLFCLLCAVAVRWPFVLCRRLIAMPFPKSARDLCVCAAPTRWVASSTHRLESAACTLQEAPVLHALLRWPERLPALKPPSPQPPA